MIGPVELRANTVPSFYDGAGRIGRWRGDPSPPATDPEDWIASTSRRTGMGDRGLTTLPDGVRLLDAVAADPAAWLGPDHVRRRGPELGVLLKLLDAGQRLPVHFHPSGEFAREHLGQPRGKVEAWLVLHAEPGASVHLGFSGGGGGGDGVGELDDATLRRWVEDQDAPALLERMNEIPVRAGDVFLCPAGVPHAIGAGILVIELQEASDLSIMLEWEGFPIDAADRFLGLDADTALSAADRSSYAGARLSELVGRTITSLDHSLPGTTPLLPAGADPYFAADHIVPGLDAAQLPPRFGVLFVCEGSGQLTGDSFEALAVSSGEVWLLPWSAGATWLDGRVSAVVCYPT